ncbi:hypothetical protein KP509_14G090500 [Ceratopteris richardii]|uniref:RRM domain-containing protein n=1 Tax=Ceratopteris richardii TaxID=49495 RepID=A0A8T2TF93_CERRI|nr:hypothetical protein KP509_14G090500 [Ceratopteris richardii]
MEPDQNKVFVGGIAWETSESRLREYFQSFGDVVDAVVMKDRATGRARGFGFVEFADASVAEKVIKEKHSLDGRTVEVKKAVRREDHQMFQRRSAPGDSSPPGNSVRTKKIFVGGLPSTVLEEDLKDFFEQFGTITDAVVMYDHSTQRPRGFGFITFDSEDAVERAVQKNFLELHDKTIEVKKAVPKEFSARFGPGRSSPFGHINTMSPSPNYGALQYLPSPGSGRGSITPYDPPPLYGPPGYGPPGIGYGVAINGGFGGSTYGSGPGYVGAYAMGYGSAPNFVVSPSYGGSGPPASPGYGSAPGGFAGPWGHGGSGYPGTSSPAYGAFGATGANAYANAYANAGWRPAGGVGQALSATSGYTSNKYNDSGYNTNTGYAPRNSSGGQAGYGEGYAAASPYGDSSWRSGDRSSPVAPSQSGSGAAVDPAVYGVTGRQPQRGPDARFRPYSASADRVS